MKKTHRHHIPIFSSLSQFPRVISQHLPCSRSRWGPPFVLSVLLCVLWYYIYSAAPVLWERLWAGPGTGNLNTFTDRQRDRAAASAISCLQEIQGLAVCSSQHQMKSGICREFLVTSISFYKMGVLNHIHVHSLISVPF